MKFGTLKNEMMKSPLGGQSVLRPKGNIVKKSLIATVILTSLVDAFSILVIYLIVNTSTSNDIISAKDMVLPKSQQSIQLEQGTVVRVQKNGYFVNDKKVSLRGLPRMLLKIQQQARQQHKKLSLIIQADQNDGFSQLNPILVSSAATGFEKIKFAVTQMGGKK